MSPMAHCLRGHIYGAVVFFDGFIAFFVVAFSPGPNGAPRLVEGLRFLDGIGVARWAGFLILFFSVFGLSVGCSELTRWGYRRLIPAGCPQCGGKAYGRHDETVTYRCQSCGHVTDTGIREGVEL